MAVRKKTCQNYFHLNILLSKKIYIYSQNFKSCPPSKRSSLQSTEPILRSSNVSFKNFVESKRVVQSKIGVQSITISIGLKLPRKGFTVKIKTFGIKIKDFPNFLVLSNFDIRF